MLTLHKLAFVVLLLAVSAAAAQQSEAYRLAPGDKVAISVFGENDLSMDVMLADDGVLKYPFLGEIRVAGLTVPELRRTIADGLRGDYLINPEVTVAIRQYRPFFLNGEVNRPGSYEYQPGLTVEKALTLAGGFSPRAARGKVEIKRVNSDTFEKVNLNDPVYAGDVIRVPQSFF